MALARLPVELLEYIIHHVVSASWDAYHSSRLRGLLRLRLVCRRFDFLLSRDCFRKIYGNKYEISQDVILAIDLEAAAWLFATKFTFGEKHFTVPLLNVRIAMLSIHLWKAHNQEYCDDVRNIKAACYAMVSHFGLEWARKKLMQERLLMLDDPRIDDQEPVMKSPLELLVLSSCLSVAASAGDLSVVQTLLQASEDPNENNSLFGYPLYAAASAGQPSCVQMLLEAGADAAISKGHLGTPMEAAACLGRLEVVRTLAHNGVDLGFSLADAIENDQISVAEFLLSLDRVDVNAGRDEDKLPIFVAMTKNHRQTAVLLAQRPELHPNVMDTRGRTPLHKAVLESEYRVARVLLSRQDVDPNIINWNLGTPLHIACTGSYTILVKEFLSHDNVDVNMEDRNGYTPLYTALLNGRRSIVSLLLQHPKVDASIGPRSQSPLVLAARGNNVEAIGPLLERPEVRASAFFYESVRQSIFVAVIQGYAQMTRLLLGRHPVNINDFSSEGWHPLHYAIRAFAHGMKLLLSIDGIDVNFLCHNLTPLICAVLTQNMEAVKLLLSRSDIDINISGPRGTALSCSLFKTDRVPAVADLLLRRADLDPNVAGRKQRTATIRITKEAKTAPVIGAYYSYFLQREGAVQEIGKPPLVKAASRGKVAVMERLLSLGTINPNAVDGDSRTALWWATNASSRAGEKGVRLLLEHPATDPNVSDCHGWSPLFMAVYRRSLVLVDMLLRDHRTDPNLSNEDSCTALRLAITTQCYDIVTRLRQHPKLE